MFVILACRFTKRLSDEVDMAVSLLLTNKVFVEILFVVKVERLKVLNDALLPEILVVEIVEA
jgi:hypothetical protein